MAASTVTPAQLSAEGCSARVQRLRGVLERRGLDCAIFEDPRDIYYFCGALLSSRWPAALMIPAEGAPVLVRNAGQPDPLLGQSIGYEAQGMCTTLRTKRLPMVQALMQAIGELPGPRVGVSAEHASMSMAKALAAANGSTIDIDSEVFALQAIKDPDELDMLRHAIAVNEVGYAALAAALRPGMTELEAFEVAHKAICEAAGQVVDYAGDYQCGQAGGPARPRQIEAGELYIIDSFPVVNGYWSDMCRTFPIGEPTGEQRKAHDKVADALALAEATVEPGMPTAELFNRLKDLLSTLPFEATALPHHAGHGIGLRAHERPYLWPTSDHAFKPGNVFCCEPSVYHDSLHGGVRIEEIFLVTDTGVEKLTRFPTRLE